MRSTVPVEDFPIKQQGVRFVLAREGGCREHRILLYQVLDSSSRELCVHHDYIPNRTEEMDGKVKTAWHTQGRIGRPCFYTIAPISTSDSGCRARSGGCIRFQRLSGNDIGLVPFIWNFLVGNNKAVDDGRTIWNRQVV
ncbi:hypothetical protein MLD38_003307 [Melastoma candidum]|uniref:Uncharacterized protein n=1 Tax=Melastoma candidum TaxID=119954 RepID=A0ACB9S1M8_9MYRT|nr:hypothetical protein MLD38_003307 [Melastoma candidum]